jgi:hypothetical protein
MAKPRTIVISPLAPRELYGSVIFPWYKRETGAPQQEIATGQLGGSCHSPV